MRVNTRCINSTSSEYVPVVDFIYLVFTCMPGERYRRCTSGGVSVPCIYMHARWELQKMYLWWSFCTLYLHACQVRVTEDVPLVEFIYLVFTCMPGVSYRRCTCGGFYLPCIYLHARWELQKMYLWWSFCTLYLHACQVRVTEDVPLVEFLYLVFTCMPGESYRRCTSGGVSVPCIYMHARWELQKMYLWWSLCTLYLHACQVRVTEDVPVVEFLYLVFTCMPGESYRRCTCGGVSVPCIYTHARWELQKMYLWWSFCTLYLLACQVRVTEDVPLVEFLYLVFTCMPGESYRRCTSGGVSVPCIYLHARWELQKMYLWWSLCALYLHACQVRYCRWLRFLLLYLCVFQALINSIVCWFCTSTLGPVLFQIFYVGALANNDHNQPVCCSAIN